MSKPDIWMPWFIGSYLADTMHLTTEQHGAYDLLLMHGWKNRGKIPYDDKQLAQITKLTPAKWRTAKPVLSPFFCVGRDPEIGAYWFQKRQVEEIEKAAERQESAGAKARRAAKTRWSKDAPSNATSTAQAMPRNASSPTPTEDPPNSPPVEFRSVAPVLYAAMEIQTPSIQEEDRAFRAWEELKAMGATAEEFAGRAARYREKWPDMPCTFKAVLANWSQMAPPKPKRGPVVPVAEYLPDSLLEPTDG